VVVVVVVVVGGTKGLGWSFKAVGGGIVLVGVRIIDADGRKKGRKLGMKGRGGDERTSFRRTQGRNWMP
jgi:hypothetical protein